MDNQTFQTCIALIGIIGTLLGTILGWILNSVSNIGRLKFYISNLDEQYLDDNYKCKLEEAIYYFFDVSLDIYNRSSIPKIMRNVKIQFYKGKSLIYEEVPDNTDTERFEAGAYHYDKIESINILPKMIFRINLKLRINIDEGNKFNTINYFDNAWLVYYNNKNQIKHFQIKKI